MTQEKDVEMVQMYDVMYERIYKKIVPGLFWSSERVVKVDTVKNHRLLEITCTSLPDVIIYNGKKVRLLELVEV